MFKLTGWSLCFSVFALARNLFWRSGRPAKKDYHHPELSKSF